MKRLQNELTALINRGVDRHLRLAVTGLSRSGKTAFITSLVNQLTNVHSGARLPLFSAARNQQLLGVKRIPQHNLSIPRFTYDEAMESLYLRLLAGLFPLRVSVKYVCNYAIALMSL